MEDSALDGATVAELLGASPRQVRRLLTRFRQEGFEAVYMVTPCRRPANRTDPATLERTLSLAGLDGSAMT